MKKKETVKIQKIDEIYPVFHRAIRNTKQTRKDVPKKIYDEYLEQKAIFITSTRKINGYFKPFKDKPVTIVKKDVTH